MLADAAVDPWYVADALIASARPQLFTSWVMFFPPFRMEVTVALTVRYVGMLDVLMYRSMALAQVLGTPIWNSSTHSPVVV